MRVRLAACLLPILALLTLMGGEAPVARAQAVADRQDRAGAPTPPIVQARAAVVLEVATGSVLYAKSAHERLPPASLTKMATAMVALERAEPERSIVASARSMVEPAVIGLDPGDRLPLREALYGLLLNSGNDVALAIAETLGDGSITTYVGWMNMLVRSLGLADTHFANPHGLDIGEHYSSAYDMAVVGRTLMRQPLLRSIVSERRHDYDGPPLWAFRNINRFLATYPGADGIKTGYEIRAGRCLAASATRNGRQLIVVVLNSEDYVADSATLMNYGFAELERRSTPGPAVRPPSGQVERLLAAAGRIGATTAERPFLRALLRTDLDALDRDPALRLAPRSTFDRLRSGG